MMYLHYYPDNNERFHCNTHYYCSFHCVPCLISLVLRVCSTSTSPTCVITAVSMVYLFRHHYYLRGFQTCVLPTLLRTKPKHVHFAVSKRPFARVPIMRRTIAKIEAQPRDGTFTRIKSHVLNKTGFTKLPKKRVSPKKELLAAVLHTFWAAHGAQGVFYLPRWVVMPLLPA